MRDHQRQPPRPDPPTVPDGASSGAAFPDATNDDITGAARPLPWMDLRPRDPTGGGDLLPDAHNAPPLWCYPLAMRTHLILAIALVAASPVDPDWRMCRPRREPLRADCASPLDTPDGPSKAANARAARHATADPSPAPPPPASRPPHPPRSPSCRPRWPRRAHSPVNPRRGGPGPQRHRRPPRHAATPGARPRPPPLRHQDHPGSGGAGHRARDDPRGSRPLPTPLQGRDESPRTIRRPAVSSASTELYRRTRHSPGAPAAPSRPQPVSRRLRRTPERHLHPRLHGGPTPVLSARQRTLGRAAGAPRDSDPSRPRREDDRDHRDHRDGSPPRASPPDHVSLFTPPERIELIPIGRICSPYKERHGTPRQPTVTQGVRGGGVREASSSSPTW